MHKQRILYTYNPTSRKKHSVVSAMARALLFFTLFLFSVSSFLLRFENFHPYLGGLPELVFGKAEIVEEVGTEVFGFAPYWKMHDLENIDFSVLTTLAYFGVDVGSDGSLDTTGAGYRVLHEENTQQLFDRARQHNTKVVLTLTQMDAGSILAFLDDKTAQKRAIEETVALVGEHDLDGVNIDMEYFGEPMPEYREKFTAFVKNMDRSLDMAHGESYVTVSVYASAAVNPRIYDVARIAEVSDGIFMMAYDFATVSSDTVMPTAPLYGHKEGKYWYDVSSAVDDFLALMPREKLILGLPWYGYNYPVSSPEEDARHPGYYSYYWRWGYRYSYYVYPDASAQTYGESIEFGDSAQKGWDEDGQVGWIAYQDAGGMWRKVYQEDKRSLAIKYDYALGKRLGGVGMWALGYDNGRKELWALLVEKFGTTLAQASE